MQPYIAIEGVIGVGKTSLARYLQTEFEAKLELEVFEENPFLARFYQDRARYGFQTQLFFLLSRYEQQQRLSAIQESLVTDYIFAKDQLFAQQNLSGDELATYERVYEALAATIHLPDLVVYLRADTPVLMAQIARRDRPYERNMDEGYIESLRVAYDQYFAHYSATPLLVIDMNELDFVQYSEDRGKIINQIRGALGVGPRQASLPGINAEAVVSKDSEKPLVKHNAPLELEVSARHLADFQRFHDEFDKVKGFDTDLLLNFALMQEEIGELARALVCWQQEQSGSHIRDLGYEMADVLAYLLKLANYTKIDLESAYIEKMKHNRQRSWESPQG